MMHQTMTHSKKHFNKLPEQFTNAPENDECIKIMIHKDNTEYIFEPIVNDVTIMEAPAWTFPFIETLRLVVKFNTRHDNMANQSLQNENFNNDEGAPLEFLICSTYFLKDIRIIAKTGDTDESSNGDCDNISEASSHVIDVK